MPFLRFDAAGQERFDGWRADLEQRLRAEDDHPVLLSHVAKYRSLMPALALISHQPSGDLALRTRSGFVSPAGRPRPAAAPTEVWINPPKSRAVEEAALTH